MISLQGAWMEEWGDDGGEKENIEISAGPLSIYPPASWLPFSPINPGASGYQLSFPPRDPIGALTSQWPPKHLLLSTRTG